MCVNVHMPMCLPEEARRGCQISGARGTGIYELSNVGIAQHKQQASMPNHWAVSRFLIALVHDLCAQGLGIYFSFHINSFLVPLGDGKSSLPTCIQSLESPWKHPPTAVDEGFQRGFIGVGRLTLNMHSTIPWAGVHQWIKRRKPTALFNCFLTMDKMWPAISHSWYHAPPPPARVTVPSNCKPK
jgi:hypothetical protein